MKYVLGLDLGIASIGWAIYDMDNTIIEKCGVRLFEPGEVKGARNNASASLSASRRLARGMRRRIRRRAYRMQKIKEHLTNSGLVSKDELANMFSNTSKTKSGTSHYDVYELRYLALDSLLSNQQLARVLIHLAKHRGFKSNRKKDKSVDGTVNTSLAENRKLLEENGYRTIGEMLYKNETFAANKRNRFGEYRVMLQRLDIGEEAKIILEAQQKLGNQLITQQFIDKYITMFNWQRDFTKAEDIQKLVGDCQFECGEKRAPKACFSSEKFIVLSKLNNIKYFYQGNEYRLSSKQIKQIFNHLLNLNSSEGFTFYDLRKQLHVELPIEGRFNFVNYDCIDLKKVENKALPDKSRLYYLEYLDSNNNKFTLNETQIQLITSKFKKPEMKYSDIRKILKLKNNTRFCDIDYTEIDITPTDAEKNTKIDEVRLSAYYQLKAAILGIKNELANELWNKLLINYQLLDGIAIVLTYNKTDPTIKLALEKLFQQSEYNEKISTDEQIAIIQAIEEKGISFKDHINLSIKATSKLIPHLESGCNLYQAQEEVGYKLLLKSQKTNKLPSVEEFDLKNPVVTRTISQLRKLIHSIIKEYGNPWQINIELARELGKTIEKRREIKNRQDENKERNKSQHDEYISFKNEHGLVSNLQNSYNNDKNRLEFIRYKLWRQQNGFCPYSNTKINLADILDCIATQIDHIIPHSRSFDDSMDNLVLCTTKCNQEKSNFTPWEYIGKNGNDLPRWHHFEERWNSMYKLGKIHGFSERKLKNLLRKEFNQEEFIKRNLQDTQYIASFCKTYLENYITFDDSIYIDPDTGEIISNKQKVVCITGHATAFVRRHWGFKKSREENDLHHAQDACVIAATTTGMVQKITRYMQTYETKFQQNRNLNPTTQKHQKSQNSFPLPSPNFHQDVLSKVSNVFVSRMPKHKISGQVHLDTIRSRKYVDKPIIITTEDKKEYVKLSSKTEILSKSGIQLGSDGEIISIPQGNIKTGLSPNYKKHNPNIYKLLKNRLERNSNDAEKAFATKLYTPLKKGAQSNRAEHLTTGEIIFCSEVEIKTIQTVKIQNNGVTLKKINGIADNGEMLFIDIFHKNGKNYIIPFYIADISRNKPLSNETVDGHTVENEYFLFRLYKKDLLRITKDNDCHYVYYNGNDIANPYNIQFIPHDGSSNNPWGGKKCQIGVQRVKIEKYQVDVLGNITRVEKEKRLDFSQLHSHKNKPA